MGALLAGLSRFGPGRLAAMGAVTLALIGFFAFVMVRATQPVMGVLFSDISGTDAAAITKELDSRGVRYETRDDGATILAPKADIPKIRMDLAGKSLPSGGGVGYEIFDKGDAFSSTSFVQGINQLRALEGELARSVKSIGRVQSARVHLVLPERRLFERDREPPRASIVLKTRGDLAPDQVNAIRHLVASAVSGLVPEKISIVDERGRLLAGGGGDEPAMAAGAAEDRRVAMERRLRTQVEEILAGIVGVGRSRVQVAADLDLNRVESRQESYDPEGRVLRSSQTRGENSASGSADGQVSVGNELPGARDGAGASAQPKDVSNKTEEVTNYEISRTTRTEILEPGRVRRLSVAVVVDGSYGKGPNGAATYQPRTKEDLDRIAALVRSAIGFDKARGDQVEVVNLPMADAPQAVQPTEPTSLLASLLQFTRDDIVRFAELGIISLLVLLVLLLVVRPMVKRIIAPDGALAAAAGLALGQIGADGVPVLAGPAGPAALAGPAGTSSAGTALTGPNGAAPAAGEPGSSPGGEAAPAPVHPEVSFLPTAHSEHVAKVAELAKAHPKDAAVVLRGWMQES